MMVIQKTTLILLAFLLCTVLVQGQIANSVMYDFRDGSVLPQTSYQQLRYPTFVSQDDMLTINSNTANEAQQFGFHDGTHGGVFFPGNSFEMMVAGDALISFFVDTYGVAEGATLVFKDAAGNVVGNIAAENIGGADGLPSSFSYEGPKGALTATLLSDDFPTAEIYLHGLSIENAAEMVASNGKIDTWDFGAAQLDTMIYNNQLNELVINSWYDSDIDEGSVGNVLPTFTVGVLSWFGGSNDRLRSTNTNLTRYDENISSAPGYTGRIYVNSRANPGRFLSLNLSEDDEVRVVTKTDNGGIINFEYLTNPEAQSDVIPITSNLTELKFVAKQAGTYRIFDTQGKPSYYRVYRQNASYADVSGPVDLSNAEGIPDDYTLVFTNEAGKQWSTEVVDGSYAINLPKGYTYTLSLTNANGYIISGGNVLDLADSIVIHGLTILKVELYTVSGSITGLGEGISNLKLLYTPDPSAEKIFVPEPQINTDSATYTVQLEPDVEYTISAEGLNDFFIPANTLMIGNTDTEADIIFELKPLYQVAINAQGLTNEQVDELTLTFTNLHEEGYEYHFTSVSDISLRDGTYAIAQGGLDDYPVELGLTSDFTIEGTNTSKTLVFSPVTNWPFDDREILNGELSYKGLLFSGVISNEIAKGHLLGKEGATIQVPVNPGEKVTVSYYYTADFSIEGGEAISTNTESTSILENVNYNYQGASSGYITITIGAGVSTSYLTNISTSSNVAYTPVLRVGPDRDFQTINEALSAVREMSRGDNARVTILIDPGNYEEMLIIDEANITLENAAISPSIEMLNEGVDIAEGAVRVTAYYGHGYHYFSMEDDQKWNADALRVNKENGKISYENKGAGTTNGSYWNATVVVYADGFEAESIIFENSFNQYISKKESEDILVAWDAGSPGIRPTDYGNTDVQKRNFKERACAIAFANGADKGILNKCRVVGRQDSFFGGRDCRIVVYKGAAMGSVDYIFGPMTAVFYKTELVMNTDIDNNDRTYITAAQQSEGVRGFLFYECTVTSAVPGTETTSPFRSKPGYFGRPWQATTSEAVFYNTTIETTDFPGNDTKSLILPEGWLNTLGGESRGMYEYGTIELSGANNDASRASWATLLEENVLNDGTEITAFNFTKGDDDWDPLPELIENEVTGIYGPLLRTAVKVHASGDSVYLSNVKFETRLSVFSLDGRLLKTAEINTDTGFQLKPGFWIIYVEAPDGVNAVKVITH